MRLILITSFLLVLLIGCVVVPTPTPLPGWEDDVRELFVDDNAFPTDWAPRRQKNVYPRANHVYRAWGNPVAAGTVSQAIWRAYTVADAEGKYAELRQSQFQPRLDPEEIVVPWEPPEEINFQSAVADEYYLACGWEEWAYCQYLARYRNYVTYFRLDREGKLGIRDSAGLTYAQIETVLEAADAKFSTALEQFSD